MSQAGLLGASGALGGLERLLAQRELQKRYEQEQAEKQRVRQEQTARQERLDRSAENERGLRVMKLEADINKPAEQPNLQVDWQTGQAFNPQSGAVQAIPGFTQRAVPASNKQIDWLSGQMFDPSSGGVSMVPGFTQRPAQSQDTNPYFVPVQTGGGIVNFNTRTGKVEGRVGDLKPGETAQREIANARTTSTMIGQVLNSLDPAKVGPAMGRYKTAEAMLTGGDPEFAAFAAAVSTLQNTVINLRTGAQMSEPEAQRILREVSDVNLPPPTFIARAKQGQAYFAEWLKNRAAGAYGRTTTGDVDAMVGGGAGPQRRIRYDLNGNRLPD